MHLSEIRVFCKKPTTLHSARGVSQKILRTFRKEKWASTRPKSPSPDICLPRHLSCFIKTILRRKLRLTKLLFLCLPTPGNSGATYWCCTFKLYRRQLHAFNIRISPVPHNVSIATTARKKTTVAERHDGSSQSDGGKQSRQSSGAQSDTTQGRTTNQICFLIRLLSRTAGRPKSNHGFRCYIHSCTGGLKAAFAFPSFDIRMPHNHTC